MRLTVTLKRELSLNVSMMLGDFYLGRSVSIGKEHCEAVPPFVKHGPEDLILNK
jgi:hypothetical protein